MESSSSSPEGGEGGGEAKVEGLELLTNGQLRAVQFLDSLWKSNTVVASKDGGGGGSSSSSSSSQNNSPPREDGGGNASLPEMLDDNDRNDDDTKEMSDKQSSEPLLKNDDDNDKDKDAPCGISAIVGGGVGSGKTYTVCAHLWQKRNAGPHLVLCSAGSLIRWRHECNKFDGLNGHIIEDDSSEGGYFPSSCYGPSDVVLIDYASFSELVSCQRHNNNNNNNLNNFASLVLDLRHPPSIGSSCNNKPSSPIESVKWWICLNNFIARKCHRSLNRLIIEQTDLPQNRFLHCGSEGSSNDGSNISGNDITKKTNLLDEKMLAMKVAFTYHPSLFFSDRVSIGKRVISWAKRQAKEAAKKVPTASNMSATLCNGGDGNNTASPSSPSCRSVLADSLQSVYNSHINVTHIIDQGNNEDEPKDATTNNHGLFWELRMCTLSKSQEVAYNQSCLDAVKGCEEDVVADGLLKLRKICIHSNLDEFISRLLISVQQPGQTFGTKNGSSVLVRNSSVFSEPSIDVAKTVVKKSSKMRELLHLLVVECGYDIDIEIGLIDNSMDVIKPGVVVPKKRGKVLILATLVEAQLLTSYFLSAVGLRHEVLVSSCLGRESDAWAWCQRVISQFNSSGGGGSMEQNHARQSVDILIASPSTLSSQNSGIGVTSADTVISLDEDWSGREAFHIVSILSKICKSKGAASKCKFIKVVCQNTCEDTFLCQGYTMKDPGSTKSLKETKRTVVTRRSARRSARTPKKNQDETEAANADGDHSPNTSPDTHTTLKKLVCPVKTKPEEASINSEGFLLPPADDGEVPNPEGIYSNEFFFIGFNVARYRRCKLSSVLCTLPIHSDLDQLFLSRKCKGENAGYGGVTFAWALFKAENDASSCVSTAGLLPESGIILRSITLNPSVPFSLGPTSAQRYIKSFQGMPSFSAQGRGKEQMRLLWCQDGNLWSNAGTSTNQDAPMGINPNTSCKEKDSMSGRNCTALLVYGPPKPAVSRKCNISDVGFTIRGGNIGNDRSAMAQNIFSFCFSSFNGQDGNQCYEPMVYFPSFLPYLLQTIRNILSVPQNDVMGGLKRKGVEGDINGSDRKRIKVSTPNEVILPSNDSSPSSIKARVSGYTQPTASEKADVGLPTNSLAINPPFSFSIETNPHSPWEDRNKSGNLELTFTRKLLAADLRGAFSCQSRPHLNSMIIISYKKGQPPKDHGNILGGYAGPVTSSDSIHKTTNPTVKKCVHKKVKKHHHSSFPPTQDNNIASYFLSDHLSAQSFSTRVSVPPDDFPALLLGRIRLQPLLNSLVSSSFSSSFKNSDWQHQLFSLSMQKRSLLVAGRESIDSKQRSLCGISLPIGVKLPRSAMKVLSSSIGDSSEPWTNREDSVLQESVSRYGMNWQLVAHAVSSETLLSASLIAEGQEYLGSVTRRSAAHCQNRIMSLKTGKELVTMAPSDIEVPMFSSKVSGPLEESVLYRDSSSLHCMEQEPGQSVNVHWLGRSMTDSVVSKSTQSTIESRQQPIPRIQMIKEISKKRRAVTTPLPGPVSPHVSHGEAIQTARASMLSAANGVAPPRNEMWPLELLDFTKKHKASANQNLQRDVARGSAPHSVNPSSQSSHRQRSSVPYHPPHNVHQTQHQMYHGAGQIPNHHPQYHHRQGHVHHGNVNQNVAYQTSQPRVPQHHHRPKEQKKGSA